MYELPVASPDGSALLTFERIVEEDLGTLDPAVPVTASLVVLWLQDRCLLVFNRFRKAWELPGGMIDPGETARQAAFRELLEESGQRPGELEFVAAAKAQVAPDDRLEYLAIYEGSITVAAPFSANEEMSDLMWWRPDEVNADLLPIDAALAVMTAACAGA